MTTIFVGGSRSISRLPAEVKVRLQNIVEKGYQVAIGDAVGADKAVQKFLLDVGYANVTVYCSGDRARNNLRPWQSRQVQAETTTKGFQFYAAKDREMAVIADFGLMIWDGRSPGTALNVLRLVRAGKKTVLLDVPAGRALAFKTIENWDSFLTRCGEDLRKAIHVRATPEEQQMSTASLQIIEIPAQPQTDCQ